MFQLAPKIIRLYRSRLSFNSDPTTVTFPEFVSYLVDERNHPLKDFHWTPQIDLCSPCGGRRRLGHINFDFIGHYETLYDDTDYVLDRLNIHPSSSMPLSYRQRNASRLRGWQSRVRAAFVSIPDDHKASLKRIYRFDFDAFGYSPDVIWFDCRMVCFDLIIISRVMFNVLFLCDLLRISNCIWYFPYFISCHGNIIWSKGWVFSVGILKYILLPHSYCLDRNIHNTLSEFVDIVSWDGKYFYQAGTTYDGILSR